MAEKEHVGKSEMTFLLIVTETPRDGFSVIVSERDGGEFATTCAPDLWTALKMAVPYMASVCQPDPFEGLLAETGQR